MSIIFDGKITMGNHAFMENDGDYRYELAKCLRELAQRLGPEGDQEVVGWDGEGRPSGITGFIKDTNGNTCGRWLIKEVDDKIRITTG